MLLDSCCNNNTIKIKSIDQYKIFEKLNECKNYEIALMTTFNFEINFFERCILNNLYNKNIKKPNKKLKKQVKQNKTKKKKKK